MEVAKYVIHDLREVLWEIDKEITTAVREDSVAADHIINKQGEDYWIKLN